MTKMEKYEQDVLQSILLAAVEEIQGIKHDNGQSPDFATFDEVFNSVKVEMTEALRELCRQHKLEYHKNVNGIISFGVKYPD